MAQAAIDHPAFIRIAGQHEICEPSRVCTSEYITRSVVKTHAWPYLKRQGSFEVEGKVLEEEEYIARRFYGNWHWETMERFQPIGQAHESLGQGMAIDLFYSVSRSDGAPC